jgi:hypothetical protein
MKVEPSQVELLSLWNRSSIFEKEGSLTLPPCEARVKRLLSMKPEVGPPQKHRLPAL